MRAPIVFLILNSIFLTGNSVFAQIKIEEVNLLAENSHMFRNIDKVFYNSMNKSEETINTISLNTSRTRPLTTTGPDFDLIDDMDHIERFKMIYQFNEFEVSKNNNKVFISWTNAYDQHVDHFEIIQYDENQKNPTIIHFLEPMSGKLFNAYQVPHQPGDETECYYQLRVYDKNGNMIVTARKRKAVNGLQPLAVFPKVTNDEIMLTNINSDNSRSLVKVVNNQGTTVKQINIPEDTDYMAINLVDLAAGEYSIKIENKKTSVTTLITKQ